MSDASTVQGPALRARTLLGVELSTRGVREAVELLEPEPDQAVADVLADFYPDLALQILWRLPEAKRRQYAVKRRKGAPKFQKTANVATTNQCGALTLTLSKPESLLAPVKRQADPFDPLTAEVDHLLCYKAKAATKLAKSTQVDVVDEFQTRRFDSKKLTRLCVPVATAGTPATKAGTAVAFTATARRHPAGHLVCYQAKAASKMIAQNGCGPVDPKSKGAKIVPKQPKHTKQLGVAINGPLGPATLDTAKEVELCLPSTAVLP